MKKHSHLSGLCMAALLCLCTACSSSPITPAEETPLAIKQRLSSYETTMIHPDSKDVISNLSADTADPGVKEAYALLSDASSCNFFYHFETSNPAVYMDTVYPKILDALAHTWANNHPEWLSVLEKNVVLEGDGYTALLLGEDAFVDAVRQSFTDSKVTTCAIDTDIPNTLPAMVFYNQQSTGVLTRRITDGIAIYSTEEKPSVHLVQDSYEGIPYTLLEVMPNEKTTVEVVSSLSQEDSDPKYLSELAEDDRTVIGMVNGGFFDHRESGHYYGYPTGAVRHNFAYEMYAPKDGRDAIECVPSYGKGFVTAWFHPYGGMEILYNGWQNGMFYKYIDDPEPNTWDYTPTEEYEEALSGAYSLLVNGEECTYGLQDSGYRSNNGTGTTLFGSMKDGRFVFLITSGNNVSLTFEQQLALVKKLGWYNALRMDGGGSSQMMVNPAYIPIP